MCRENNLVREYPHSMLSQLFQSVDERDAGRFAGFLSEDCTFVFANQPPVSGRGAVREAVAAFFASVAGLSHTVTDFWEVPGGLVCHGTVTYTRRDGSTLSVPFANILKLRDGLIYDYRIFADISELYRQV